MLRVTTLIHKTLTSLASSVPVDTRESNGSYRLACVNRLITLRVHLRRGRNVLSQQGDFL